MSWQVQCGRRTYVEHPQFHQHVGVRGWIAERTRRWDVGYDVSPDLCSSPAFTSIWSSAHVSQLVLISSCLSFLPVCSLSLTVSWHLDLSFIPRVRVRIIPSTHYQPLRSTSGAAKYDSHLYLSIIYNFLPLSNSCLNFAPPNSKVQRYLQLSFNRTCPSSPILCLTVTFLSPHI